MSEQAKRVNIVKGPDRMELMSNFALRNQVLFELEDGSAINVIINGISVESADCHSWLLIGFVMSWGTDRRSGAKFEGYYRTHPRTKKEDEWNKGSSGHLDITLKK